MAFASIPPGFFAANEVLNELPGELLSRMIGDGQRYIRRQVESMPTEEYAKMAPAGASLASVRSATNAVVYILRQLSLSKAEGKAASALLESETDLNEAARAAFSETGQGATQDQKSSSIRRALNVGKLVDIKWKLGMGVSSNTCKNLAAPFVTLSLKIVDPNQQSRVYTLELNLEQFQEFRQTFKNIAVQIDQV